MFIGLFNAVYGTVKPWETDCDDDDNNVDDNNENDNGNDKEEENMFMNRNKALQK